MDIGEDDTSDEDEGGSDADYQTIEHSGLENGLLSRRLLTANTERQVTMILKQTWTSINPPVKEFDLKGKTSWDGMKTEEQFEESSSSVPQLKGHTSD